MSEAELAEVFISHFKDYEIYKEVPTNYGRCDFFAIKAPIYISVEVKKQFNTLVIYQAYRNLCQSNYAYVAVPRPKDGGYHSLEICKALGIGVLCHEKNDL